MYGFVLRVYVDSHYRMNIPHHLTFTLFTRSTTTPHISHPRQTSYLSKSTTAAVLKLDTSPLKAEAL